jgi:TonB family protein
VQLRLSGRNEKLPPLLNAVAERCSTVLQTNTVPILFSSKTKAPLTLGMRKPLIILPESFLHITSEETLTAAVGHELAHIRRRDYGLNLVCEFLSLLISFHPAVTVMKRNIDQTREMACDELVSEHLLRPLDYARSLVQIAGFISPANQNAFTVGVFNADILEKRIMKLIEKSRGTKSRTGKIRFLFVSALLSMSAVSIPAFSLALPTNQIPETKSEKKESNNKNEEKVYKVEMYSNGERVASVTLTPDTPGRTKYGYVLRTIPKNQIATTLEGEKVYALQLLPRLQKDTVKVEVIALLEDPETISNEHPLDKLKKQLVSTYNISEGEQITLSEMTQFGMLPLEIRVTFGDKTNPTDKDRQTKTVISTIQPNKKDSETPADKEFSTTAKGDGAQPLRILSKSTAQYTNEARRNGTAGTVQLRVTFLASGAIGDISPVNSLPDGLTQAAIEAAKGIKFEPATENGTPLTVTKLIEYSFTNF